MEKALPVEKLHTALLVLLRAGLWERAIDDATCFPLSAEAWAELFRLSRQQTVTGIVFRGMQFLPESLLPAPSLLIRWTAAVDAIERRNRDMNGVLSELYALFRSNGLDPVLQKGQGVAAFYESPLLRECGDIDLWFGDPRASDAARDLISLRATHIRRMPDQSLFYRWRGIAVEHHTRLFDLHNPFLQSSAKCLGRENGFVRMPLSGEDGAMITVPSPLVNLLLLDLHVLKHALGRGIGLRQLCDMARACYRLHAEVKPGQMKKLCDNWGLGRWNPLLHVFMVDCLGLPSDCLPYGELAPTARPLLEIVWRGGNFGQHDPELQTSGRTIWTRKISTARSFCRNLRFAVRYVPKEAFWICVGLMKGQFRK